jgi:hypothetical protein
MSFRPYLESLIERDSRPRTYCTMEFQDMSCKQSEAGNVPEQGALDDPPRGGLFSARSDAGQCTWLARSFLALHEACVRSSYS